MKILQICPRYSPYKGGVERIVKNLAEYLAKQNHQVTVYATDPSSKLPSVRVNNAVSIKNYFALAPKENFHLPHPKMLIHLLREKADIIHAHSVHDLTILVAQAAHKLDKKSRFVVSPYYHGGGHTKLTEMLWVPYRFVMRKILREADAIIVNSKILENELNRTLEPSRKIFVVYDGVNLNEINNAEPFVSDEKVRIVLYVGRLEKYKNIHVTISSMKYLPDNYHFYIIGQGPFKPYLMRLVQSLALKNRVHFLGYLPDDVVYRWFKAAHIFVHLSAVESFGMTCIESLAAGTPVVANDDGFGLGETIALYPKQIMVHRVGEEPVSELAKSIAEVAELKPITADVSRFSWNRIAESIGAIYRQTTCS